MALTILVTPQTGDTIEAGTWANEFNNIYNNSLSLISPLTGTLNLNNNSLTNLNLGTVSAPSVYFNSDANTGIYSRTADTFNITCGSSIALEVGSSWILAAAPEDARTNEVDVVGEIRSTTSGTPAAGIGVGILFTAESQDENPCNFGRIDFAATDIGTGTEDTYMDVLLRVAGAALTTAYRFSSTGTARINLTHAAGTNRIHTIPDVADDTFALIAASQTLTNKTITAAVLSGTATGTYTLGGTPTLGANLTVSSGIDITGLDELGLGDAAANATAAGRLRRNSTSLTWHDGTAARTAAMIDGGQSFTSATWTATAIGAQYGGTGLNSSASSGVPSVNSGTWTVNNVLTANQILYGAASNTITSSANLNYDGNQLTIGSTTGNANMTIGFTVKQGANDDEAAAWKSSDVAHNRTTFAETDTWLSLRKADGATGGAEFRVLAENANARPLFFRVAGATPDTVAGTTANPAVYFSVQPHDNANAAATIAANSLIFGVGHSASGTETAAMFIDSEGDFFLNGNGGGTAANVTTFDAEDDLSLVRAFDLNRAADKVIRSKWDEFVKAKRADLIRTGIITNPTHGDSMVCVSQLQRLHNGALWQLGTRVMELEAKLAQLEDKRDGREM